jgi:uncharacterized protein YdbL (DUF1318 family)
MKYEYIEVVQNQNHSGNLIDQINEKAKEGYRLVSTHTTDAVEVAILEKQTI